MSRGCQDELLLLFYFGIGWCDTGYTSCYSLKSQGTRLGNEPVVYLKHIHNLPGLYVVQLGPPKSSVTMHVVSVPYPSMHVPPLRQVLDVQKLRSELQLVPVKPAAQLQVVKVPGPSMHVPPLRHVSTSQNGRSMSQLAPVNPSTQIQLVSVPYPSMHVPPLRQVPGVQKLRSELQFSLVKPVAQIHVPCTVHVPPLVQGLG